MNVRKYFYSKEDGALLYLYDGPAEQLVDNTPPNAGHVDADLVTDPPSQRINVLTGAVIDWQPPRPSDGHYWDTQARRWFLDPIVEARNRRTDEIMQTIKGIDERMIRPGFELMDDPDDAVARDIYSKLKAEKVKLRAELKSLSGK